MRKYKGGNEKLQGNLSIYNRDERYVYARNEVGFWFGIIALLVTTLSFIMGAVNVSKNQALQDDLAEALKILNNNIELIRDNCCAGA